MLPIDQASLSHPLLFNHLLALLLGFGLGTVLENSGLGDPRRNSGQYYFRNFTAFKLILTAILTTSLLTFLAGALGLLDTSALFVSSTHLWPGLVGGVVMGLGLLIGGYFIETALVSAASLKLDALAFLGGAVVGSILFGETLEAFRTFWHGGFISRFTLPDALGWSLGRTLVWLTLALCALLLLQERFSPGEDGPEGPRLSRWAFVGTGCAVALAALVALLGQPSPTQVWNRVKDRHQPLLDARTIFINSLEYAKASNNSKVKLIGLDLRSQAEFAAFHLASSRNLAKAQLTDRRVVDELTHLPAQAAVVLIADEEPAAIEAWKLLKAQGVTNLFILDKGLVGWRNAFSGVHAHHFDLSAPSSEALADFPPEAFTTRLKLQAPKAPADLYRQSN